LLAILYGSVALRQQSKSESSNLHSPTNSCVNETVQNCRRQLLAKAAIAASRVSVWRSAWRCALFLLKREPVQDHLLLFLLQPKCKRSVPPCRCRRTDREPDAQGEGVQHQGERCRGNCAGDDRTPLQIEDSLYQRCRMSIRRRAWLHKPWALRMSWHDLSCRR
jgi:hypothetical protein